NLPKTVSEFGTTKEEIFVSYETLKEKYGKDIERIPLGAIGIYTYADRLRVGLQQIMAGSRCMNLNSITRDNLIALTPEAAQVSGITYVMDSFREQAFEIIRG
ncbi:MAG: hypothetical protein LBH56_04120, partial [Coriobacteriales bacterium]|nr:hypothetical protein [Coriobacteriales bacterium]